MEGNGNSAPREAPADPGPRENLVSHSPNLAGRTSGFLRFRADSAKPADFVLRSCECPLSSVALLSYPTLLTLTNTSHRGQIFDGVDLAPMLTGKAETLTRKAIFWHDPHYHSEGAVPYGAIRKGDWKLIENFEDNRVELYNLATDLGEKSDLAGAQPARRDELLSDLRAWRKQVGAQMPTVASN